MSQKKKIKNWMRKNEMKHIVTIKNNWLHNMEWKKNFFKKKKYFIPFFSFNLQQSMRIYENVEKCTHNMQSNIYHCYNAFSYFLLIVAAFCMRWEL